MTTRGKRSIQKNRTFILRIITSACIKYHPLTTLTYENNPVIWGLILSIVKRKMSSSSTTIDPPTDTSAAQPTAVAVDDIKRGSRVPRENTANRAWTAGELIGRISSDTGYTVLESEVSPILSAAYKYKIPHYQTLLTALRADPTKNCGHLARDIIFFGSEEKAAEFVFEQDTEIEFNWRDGMNVLTLNGFTHTDFGDKVIRGKVVRFSHARQIASLVGKAYKDIRLRVDRMCDDDGKYTNTAVLYVPEEQW